MSFRLTKPARLPSNQGIPMLKRSLAILTVSLTAFLPSQAADDGEFKLGMQTWSLRNLSFEDAMNLCVKEKIKYVQLIPGHVNPSASKEELQRKKDFMLEKGLIPYTFGVAGTSLNKEENRKLFEFAKFMGMKLIVVEPGDFKILDQLEELAKEYDIKVAIHNHDVRSMYGNPLVVKNVLKHRDPHIGVCMDAGWVASGRFNVPKIFKEYEGRVYDIHLKDKKVESTPSGDKYTDTFIGEGDAKLAELFKVAKEMHYDGVFAIETDNNLKDPTEHVEKAVAFVEKNKP
jgi:sugar phosphate isomerase/epimerase